MPSGEPTGMPAATPAGKPTSQPSGQPSATPSSIPSSEPSVSPSSHPSHQPSNEPSAMPSSLPSSNPSACPTGQPSLTPSRQPSSVPTMSPSEVIFHDFAPDIKSIVAVVLTGSLTVRVDLSLESAAEVHCGIFYDSYALLNVSAVAIRFQKWYNVSFIESSTMTITGLQEGTKYSLYCVTSTVVGRFDMSLANILTTRTVVDVPCVSSPTCGASVVVDIFSKNVLISDYMQSVLTVGLDNSYMLQEDMVVVVDVTLFDPDGTHELPDCASSGVVVTPRVLSYYGGVEPSSSSPMEVHVGSLCPGPYQVVVSMYRVDEYTSSSALLNTSSSSLSGVSVEYSNGNLLYFFPSDASFMAPQVMSAMFMGSANEVVITFDSSTDFAGGLVRSYFSTYQEGQIYFTFFFRKSFFKHF